LDSRLDAFVISAEQRKHSRDVRFIPDVEADPPRIGQVMMPRNFAARHELITDRLWKRKIGDVTAVEVADLDLADVKSTPAEAMPARGHARPTQEFMFNGFTDFHGRFHFQLMVSINVVPCLQSGAGVREYDERTDGLRTMVCMLFWKPDIL
jgi:hypothetical protein